MTVAPPRPCAYCGTRVRANARFCGRCGRSLPLAPAGNVPCPVCRQPNHPDASYCAYCQTALTPGAPPLAPALPSQSRSLPVWFWTAAGIAVLLILAGSGWILLDGRPTAAPRPDSTPTTEAMAQAPTSTFTPTLTPTISPTPTPTTRADSLPIGAEPGQRAPDFALKDLDGKAHRLTDYDGQVLVLDFWATWCGYCREQLPILQAVSDKYAGQGVTILTLDQKESVAQVTSYRDQSGITLTMLLDTRGQVGNDYAVRGLPTLYFIGRDGVIHAKKPGLTGQAEVEAEIEILFARSTSP